MARGPLDEYAKGGFVMDYKLLLAGTLVAFGLAGCSRDAMLGGAAVGAAAGGAYEYNNKKSLEDLRDDYEDGKIDKDEYQRRKREIEDRSLVY
jgi:hypothetical protein